MSNKAKEFCLTEYSVEVELCGLTYYAALNGLFVLDKADAFDGFTLLAAKRVRDKLAKDSQIKVAILETVKEAV